MKHLLFLNLGTGEIILIALVILLLFGAKRLPELAKSVGKSVKSFKSGLNEVEKEIKDSTEESSEKKKEE
ncbi:MAG: twin-arginine translocase TatA/TatE family subunit [Bacteroidales bacterium]|nr:twin-arginine translocase TatA/TatE family subunit [Bacteroidales bacterium]MBQ9596667.1 twin-arginine translocase TatA/TatE family subunit [Bacteroidales bacterium]MCR4565502.1 twin-arginine translocase TatA/TatE family subunit [Bacteroidales bacterium]